MEAQRVAGAAEAVLAAARSVAMAVARVEEETVGEREEEARVSAMEAVGGQFR